MNHTAVNNNVFVSVVMSMYNAEKYLYEAVDSILKQTWTHFEFIIINNGSTDNSLQILNTFNDQRIRLFTFDETLTLAEALNHGIKQAKGNYIVRMDADDISVPERLAVQVNYMQANPGVAISGTQMIALGNKSRRLPLTHHDIKWHILNACPMLHPSVIMRRPAIEEHQLYYDPAYYGIEDLELWMRASHVVELSNLDRAYVKYRYHNSTHKAMMDTVAKLNTRVKVNHLALLIPEFPQQLNGSLAIILNRHITHNRNKEWWHNALSVFEEALASTNQFKPELITEFNKCIWFHLSSEPRLYPAASKLFSQHPWVKLSLKQKAWLMVKPYLANK